MKKRTTKKMKNPYDFTVERVGVWVVRVRMKDEPTSRPSILINADHSPQAFFTEAAAQLAADQCNAINQYATYYADPANDSDLKKIRGDR